MKKTNNDKYALNPSIAVKRPELISSIPNSLEIYFIITNEITTDKNTANKKISPIIYHLLK